MKIWLMARLVDCTLTRRSLCRIVASHAFEAAAARPRRHQDMRTKEKGRRFAGPFRQSREALAAPPLCFCHIFTPPGRDRLFEGPLVVAKGRGRCAFC